MEEDILQQFIDSSGKYLIGQKYVKGFGAMDGKDEWYAVFLSPNIDRELWDKKIVDLPYKVVKAFAQKEILTNIYLGDVYPPFQYGVRYKDFTSLREVTCVPNELIYKCYKENITDYYKVLEVMEELTKKEN